MKISDLLNILLVTVFSFSSFAAEKKSGGGAFSGGKNMNDENNTGKAIGRLDEAEALQTWENEGQEALEAVRKCKAAAVAARRACLANFSEHIQTGAALVQAMISGMGVLSASQACSKHSKAMKGVQVALTLYNTACTGFQVRCSSSCGTSKTKIAEKKVQLGTKKVGYEASGDTPMANNASVEMKFLDNMTASVENQISICEGYKWNLAAAGAGLLSAISQSNISKSCEKATTAGTDGSGVAGNVGSVDCADAKFADNPECICQQKPNSQGCAGYTGSNSLAGPGGSDPSAGLSASANLNPAAAASLTSSGDDFVSPTGSGTAASKLGGAGGAPGSGAAGGGGLSGGGPGKAGGADAVHKSGLNANILAGQEGGGGGGGRSQSGRGYSDFYPSQSKYKAYLPGGANDPKRGLAAQTFGNGQVTGAGSKSNWQKIRERYKDNKPTLMGN